MRAGARLGPGQSGAGIGSLPAPPPAGDHLRSARCLTEQLRESVAGSLVRHVRHRFPDADVFLRDVGPVSEPGRGTRRAVLAGPRRVITLVCVSADERDPAHSELARAAALLAVQHRRTPSPRRAPRHATTNLTRHEGHLQVPGSLA